MQPCVQQKLIIFLSSELKPGEFFSEDDLAILNGVLQILEDTVISLHPDGLEHGDHNFHEDWHS